MHLQISRKSNLNTQIVPTTRPLFDRKCSSAAVLLYKPNALRVTWMVKRDAARQWNSRQRGPMSNLEAETYHQRQLLTKFSKIEIFDPTCVIAFRLPCIFICSDFWIRGPTWTYSSCSKCYYSKWIHKFQEIQQWTPEFYQSDCRPSTASSPSPRYYSTS